MLNRLATVASTRKIGRGGAFQSDDWNATIAEILATLASIQAEWNANLQPILDSLPQGRREIDVENVIATPNPRVNGLDGADIYMDLVASSTRDDGLFWDPTLERPRTIKEGVLEVRRLLHLSISALEASITGSTDGALTDAQKARIGMNIFDATQASSDNSNEGRSINNQLNILQLAADVFGDVTVTGQALDGADYALNMDGLRSLANGSSIVERLIALEAAAPGTLDSAYTQGQTVAVDLASGIQVTMTADGAAAGATETLELINALANTTDCLRINRTLATDGGYAIWVENGRNLFRYTEAGGGATNRRSLWIDLENTGAGTGNSSGVEVFADADYTSDTSPLQGFWSSLAPSGNPVSQGFMSDWSTANLGGEPVYVDLYRAVLTHANAGQSPATVRGFHFAPDLDALADTLPALEGFHFNPGTEIDNTVTNLYGFRGTIAAGSGGTVTNLYGLRFDLDATNLGSTVSTGIHLGLTTMKDGLVIDHDGSPSGANLHSIFVDADITVGADQFWGCLLDLSVAQGAGGPTVIQGYDVLFTDGNHLANPAVIALYAGTYNHTDVSNRPTLLYGHSIFLDGDAGAAAGGTWAGFRVNSGFQCVPATVNLFEAVTTVAPDCSGTFRGWYTSLDGASVSGLAYGSEMDLSSMDKGLWIHMDGDIPAATTWALLHLEDDGVTSTADDRILQGLFVDLAGSAIADTDRIRGIEISLPAGMRQGIIFTADGQHDIGRDGANRPRNLYVQGEVKVGDSVTIDLNSVSGSSGLSMETVAGDVEANPAGVTRVGKGVKSDGREMRNAEESVTIGAATAYPDAFATEASHTYLIRARVCAIRSDSQDAWAAWDIEGAFYRPAAGGPIQIGATTLILVQKAGAAGNYDVTFDIGGNNVRTKVTGDVGHTVEWGCVMDIMSMGV